MSDLISRQAAIDTVMKFMPSLTTPDGCGQFDKEIYEAQEMFVDIGQALNDLPSAERRGRWIYKSELYSYCGHPFYPKICSVCNGVFEYTTNYCPNCGARMEATE